MKVPRSQDEAISRRFLWHPALVPRTFEDSGALRGLANLRGEQALVHALLAILSGLAAIETEKGASWPSPADWALGEDGFPVLRQESNGLAGEESLARHLQLFLGLFGGRTARDGCSVVLPRRHPHHDKLSSWFGRWISGNSPAKDALLDLIELVESAGIEPGEFPCEWGCSALWNPSLEITSPGMRKLRAHARSELSALAGWCAKLGYRRVRLAEAPYPFSGLEPIARAALNCSEKEARAWLSARCSTPADLAAELRAMLQPSAWCLWPGEALDGASLAVLAEAAGELPKPFILVVDGVGATSAGAFTDIKALWLPDEGGRWFATLGQSLFGKDGAALLSAVESLPSLGLAPGKGLLLPLFREEGRKYAGGQINPEDPISLWRAAALAEENGETKDAAVARAKAFLALGQAAPALSQTAKAEAAGLEAPDAALLRARAYEREMDYPKAAKAIAAIDQTALPREARVESLLLEGQSLWIGGLDAAKGLTLLRQAAELAETPEERARALTALATACLHRGEMYEARRLLDEAKAALQGQTKGRALVSLLYSFGVYQRKLGKYEEAAEQFLAAAKAAGEALDLRQETAALAKAGDALRLSFRFGEANGLLLRAQEGAWTLGLQELRETARFNRTLCILESGRLLEAQQTLEAGLKSGKSAGPIDQAIDHYWLARILYARGDLPSALAEAQKGLGLARGTRNSEVEAPLAIIEARLLLASHDAGRFSRRVDALKEIANRAPDPDDRLEAASLLLEASIRSPSTFGAQERNVAASAEEMATKLAKARWRIASARTSGGKEAAGFLREALGLARETRDPAVETEILWELYHMGELPPDDEEASARVINFIRENQIRGPWRELLSVLERKPGNQGTSPVPLAGEDDAGLILLEQAMSQVAHGEALLALTGARAGAVARPGGEMSFWRAADGGPTTELSHFLGRTGLIEESSCWIYGAEGRDGLWHGFLWEGPKRPSDAALRLARLWAALYRVPAEAPGAGGGDDSAAARSIILGDSPLMSSLRAQVAKAADFSFPVLVTGEPGTGKEVCARAIHLLSSRRNRPWVPANGANLSPALATSLLFGHKRGAFTGADKDAEGLVESAKGGTLFLDEVGELPIETQAQLLRFLQDGSYTPLGETKPKHSDARLIAATNRDLDEEAAAGRFRKDLLHRLKVLCITVPPLRERKEDIPLLFSHFFKQAAEGERIACPEMAGELWGPLMAYHWPGNVRELQNAARALLVASHEKGVAEPRLLPPHLRDARARSQAGPRLRSILDEAERKAVEEALRNTRGNAAQAAKSLGISRQALSRKLAKWREA